MTDTPVTTVEFEGATLWGVRGKDRHSTRVAMKPLVEGMGLDWARQFTRLKDHPVLAATVGEMPMVAEDGRLRSMITLPLPKLPFWLATIQPNKVPNPKVRARVIAFQSRVADVLEAAFFGVSGRDPVAHEMAPLCDLTLSQFLNLPVAERQERRLLVGETRHTIGPRSAHGLFQRIICRTAELGGAVDVYPEMFDGQEQALISGFGGEVH